MKGGIILEEKISLNKLRKVKGIGSKTIGRIKEQMREDKYVSKYNPELHLEENSINLGDCLELMNGIPDKSVDMILADLPYDIFNRNDWDNMIDLNKLWLQYERIIKEKGVIVLTATQPFVTELINSNKELFKYDWICKKSTITGVLNAKTQPVRNHEHILVFYKKFGTYNPQGVEKVNKITRQGTNSDNTLTNRPENNSYKQEYTNYPRSVQEVSWKTSKIHPTEKPVKLFEYLIKTYTNEGDVVLDNVCGCGTTAIACLNTSRKYICIEKENKYYDLSVKRASKI